MGLDSQGCSPLRQAIHIFFRTAAGSEGVGKESGQGFEMPNERVLDTLFCLYIYTTDHSSDTLLMAILRICKRERQRGFKKRNLEPQITYIYGTQILGIFFHFLLLSPNNIY